MKDWLKKHYVGLSAGVIAIIALAGATKGCDGNEDANARIDFVEANIDSLTNNQNKVIEVVNNHKDRIDENRQNIDRLRSRVSAVEDSIDVHRADIDSLKVRVDSVAKRQEKCPCINPKTPKKTVRRPARPNNAPVCRDTVIVYVKPENVAPVQNANGCGDDQNANVVIRGDNNTVNVSNNGNDGVVSVTDPTKNEVRTRVVATCTMHTRVKSNFTWKTR